MKIGIITIIDYKNYGNRLQNYAVQNVLESFGLTTVTIKNSPGKYNLKRNSLTELLKNKEFVKISYLVRKRISHRYLNKKSKGLDIEKAIRLEEFSEKFINESDFLIKELEIPKGLENDFDFFVTGSDQVWNPLFRRAYPIDFLEFAPPEKRIAYAPSFGIDSLPIEFATQYKDFLNNIKSLSVREEAGAKIIKELTGREAEVLLDPTLMLDKKKWLEISKKSSVKPKGKYLLTYFLGKINRKKRKKITTFAKENNLEIVNLADVKHRKYYTIDPSEFLDFINCSEIFFTDSFHGVVFSILFKKPFLVFERGNMNSRLDTLLSKFELEHRKEACINNFDNLFDVDFSHTQKILENERSRTMEFLSNAINLFEKK